METRTRRLMPFLKRIVVSGTRLDFSSLSSSRIRTRGGREDSRESPECFSSWSNRRFGRTLSRENTNLHQSRRRRRSAALLVLVVAVLRQYLLLLLLLLLRYREFSLSLSLSFSLSLKVKRARVKGASFRCSLFFSSSHLHLHHLDDGGVFFWRCWSSWSSSWSWSSSKSSGQESLLIAVVRPLL